MGRDEALEEEGRIPRRKYQIGVWDREQFDRLAPPPEGIFVCPRTARAFQLKEPDATRAWVTLWIAHRRHPVFVARALAMLLLYPEDWSGHLVAQMYIAGFRKVATFRNSPIKEWVELVLGKADRN